MDDTKLRKEFLCLKNEKMNTSRMAKKLKVSVQKITELRNALRLKTGPGADGSLAASVPVIKKKYISVKDLVDMERLDVEKILKDGIAAIPRGAIAYDDQLRRDLRIPQPKWRDLRSSDKFEACRAMLPNRKVVWGREETIASIKQQYDEVQ